MIQTRDTKLFFKYVFPSILSFALSGVYAIVDGFFVGNSLGDVGLSAVNIAYPIVAFIQAVGTGIGMGGAIYYSINKAEKKEKEARMFTAGANWLMIIFSVILTVAVFLLMLVLPPLFGGQVMIWWSTVIARILSAILALLLKSYVDRHDLPNILSKGAEK